MGLEKIRDSLEGRQIAIYFGVAVIALGVALFVPGATMLEAAVNPALAFMLYVTFLQVPLADLSQALKQTRFIAVLLLSNFIAMPALVFALAGLLPDEPVLRLGVLLVLLAPCIDYVVTFAHLGRADARALLASTPVLLLVQMLLLPLYLKFAFGRDVAFYIDAGPFLHAFLWLIAAPLALAGLTQFLAARRRGWGRAQQMLGLAPVPATALVLFIVIAAVAPQLGSATGAVLLVLPVYLAYAIIAPMCGWWLARRARLGVRASRAVAFSSATRNSLVVLPLALSIPGAIPTLPAVIVTQTLVELLAELVYVRLVARWGASEVVRADQRLADD